MRRIIERVVTVVTTTTWKISWETDPSHAQPPFVSAQGEADTVTDDLPASEILQGTPPNSVIVETKEVHPHENENLPDSAKPLSISNKNRKEVKP